MMPPLPDGVERVALVAGWSVIVALWHTSVIALGLAAWRLWRRDAPARRQHLAASSALALATALTLATPAALLIERRSGPSAAVATVVASGALAVPGGLGAPAARTGSVHDWQRAIAVAAAVAVPWIGALWGVGFFVGLVRLGGGWGLAQWIRRRATAVRSTRVVDAAADASATWGLPPATLLTSAHVDAPVVVGTLSPAVLLPIDLEQRLAADALAPLLAHELAHVNRRDYAANLVQSLADAVLFFSPGARWISRAVRETREYCCDDVVAARCGTGAYVTALTTLAGLGVAARARPAVHAAGPRLIVRIRRLLEEAPVPQHVTYRLAGIAAALLSVAVATPGVISASAAAVRSARTQGQPVAESEAMMPVAVSFVREQAGSALVLESLVPTAGGMCGVATLYNKGEVAVRGVRFEAAVSRTSGSQTGGSLALGDLRAVTIHPGTRAIVAANFMSADDALSTGGAGPVHVRCSLVAIDYVNGTRWFAPPASSVPAVDVAEAPTSLASASAANIPMGFVHTQPGAALTLRSMQPTAAGLCGVAEVENLANVAITGLRFAAFTHAPPPGVEGSSLTIGSFGTSALLRVDVAPRQIATVQVGLMSKADVHANLRVSRAPVLCGVAEIHYANGATWQMRGHTIFGPEHAEVPRRLLGALPSADAPLCRDESGGWFSEGAIVPISQEPVSFARCLGGTWREYELPARTPGKAFVWLEIIRPDGRTSKLGVEPGDMARLQLKAASWGLVPTVDPADERRVRVEIDNLAVDPKERVADFWTTVGAPPVDVSGASFAVRVRSTRNP